MAPKLVLTYFDMGGSADAIRFALEIGGLDWEDKRLSREEFQELKPSEYTCMYRHVELALYLYFQVLVINSSSSIAQVMVISLVRGSTAPAASALVQSLSLILRSIQQYTASYAMKCPCVDL